MKIRNMRWTSAAAALVAPLVALSGCAVEQSGTVSDTCQAVLECVATVATESSAAANESYGSASDCWQSAAAAEDCTAACQLSLEDYHAMHPDEPACDDGIQVGTNVLFPSGARFRFQSEVNNAQCDADIRVILVEVLLEADVTPTFSWAGDINGARANTGFDTAYASECALDGSDWTCAEDPVSVDVGDGVTVSNFNLNGMFSADLESATATLSYTITTSSGPCTQSQSMSGAQP